MRFEARFVVETCAHVTTLYRPKEGGAQGELEFFDDSPFTLYEMARYGVDMCIIKSSGTGGMRSGPTNEIAMLAQIAERHPDQFRACCGSNVDSQTRDVEVLQGRKMWSLDMAADDMATALQTGKFVGMGEFLPRNLDRRHAYTFQERLDEVRRFMDLAAKYDVTIDWHEFTMHHGWDPYHQLSQIAREYPEVPIIVCHGGYSIGSYAAGADVVRKSCRYAGMADNIYLETGTWPAEYFQIPLKDPNVGATQLLWGGDYGNVPNTSSPNRGRIPPVSRPR